MHGVSNPALASLACPAGRATDLRESQGKRGCRGDVSCRLGEQRLRDTVSDAPCPSSCTVPAQAPANPSLSRDTGQIALLARRLAPV